MAPLLRTQQPDGVLRDGARVLATDGDARVKVAHEWQQVAHDTENMDVLERCKRLNEFLSQDFTQLKGNPKTQRELQHILAMLSTPSRQRPACLAAASTCSKPAAGTHKRTSLADSAAVTHKPAVGLVDDDDEAMQLLSLLHDDDMPQQSCTTSISGSSAAASTRPSTGEAATDAQGCQITEHADLSDLICLLNAESSPAAAAPPSKTSMSTQHTQRGPPATTAQGPQEGAGQSHTAGAMAIRQLQDRMRAQKDGTSKSGELAFKALVATQGDGTNTTTALAAAKQAAEEVRRKAAAEAAARQAAAEAATQKAAAEAAAASAAAAAAAARKAQDAAARKAAEEAARRAAEEAARRAAAQAAAQKAAAEAAAREAAEEAAALKAAEEAAARKAAEEAAARKAAEQAAQLAAVVLLQSCWRTRVSQWQVRQVRAAATCLQCAARRRAAMLQHQWLLEVHAIRQHIMARRIQRAWRAWHTTRGWKLGELRRPPRPANCDDPKAVMQAGVGRQPPVPVRVRSTADTRLAPAKQPSDSAGQQPGAGGPLRRTASAARERSTLVAQQEEVQRLELGARVVMTASLHRSTSDAMAIATQRSTPHRQLSLQRTAVPL